MDKKYRVVSKISSGKFGDVYKGVFMRTSEPVSVAIKMEFLDTDVKTLSQEVVLLNYLYEKGSRHTPCIHWYGKYKNRQVMVLPLYEQTIDKWYEQDPEMSKIKLPKIMAKMIHILQTVHKAGVVHRDIKPQNIMICNDIPYLIDFGLATIYVDEDGKHLRHGQDNKQDYILGTPKFVSMHVHNGYYGTRRDDMISLCYVYTYIVNNGQMFWDRVQEDTSTIPQNHDIGHILHKNNQYILSKKREYHSYSNTLFEHLYSLDYMDTPQYPMIYDTFLTISSNKLGL